MADLKEDENLKNESKKKTLNDKTLLYIVVSLSVGFIAALLVSLIFSLIIINKKEDIVVNELSPDFLRPYEEQAEQAQKEAEKEESSDQDELDEDEESFGAFFPLDSFVVNLVGGGFLKAQIFIEFKTREVPPSFLAKIVPAKDSIIDILSGRKASELKTVRGKELLKTDIKDLLNTLLGREKQLVKDIYFTTYIIKG
ncbi:MAG: flagellar basal body-associated FliL family protein [Bdellovibrionota bacterium]